MFSNFSITLIIIGIGILSIRLRTMTMAMAVIDNTADNAETSLTKDEYRNRTRLQINAHERFLFDDNPDERELTKRGCCRCGNAHHCCGNMCYGK